MPNGASLRAGSQAAHNRGMRFGSGGLPWRRLLTAALAAAAIFLYWMHVTERGARQAARPTATTESPLANRGWGASVGFVDQRRLEEHYEKHGREFGHITRQDYLHQAQLLRDAKVGDPILEVVRSDGVMTRYDRQTGAFIAVNPNGTI